VDLFLIQSLKDVLTGQDISIRTDYDKVKISSELDEKLRQLGYGK
jgi:hypothetical protein